MSRIVFTTRTDGAEVLGSERAYMGTTLHNIALGALNLDSWSRAPYAEVGPDYVRNAPDHKWADNFRVWWSVNLQHEDLVPGLSPFQATLNTGVVLGGHVELMARIHATCEIHGYVEAEHAEWFGGLIAKALDAHVLREGAGWDGVVALCDGSSPVVMSYTICDIFPNPWEMGMVGEDDEGYEEWEALSAAEQFDRGMEWIREHWEGLVDITPEVWNSRGFGNGWSVFDLDHHLCERTKEQTSG